MTKAFDNWQQAVFFWCFILAVIGIFLFAAYLREANQAQAEDGGGDGRGVTHCVHDWGDVQVAHIQTQLILRNRGQLPIRGLMISVTNKDSGEINRGDINLWPGMEYSFPIAPGDVKVAVFKPQRQGFFDLLACREIKD